jgi:hypothetical protein
MTLHRQWAQEGSPLHHVQSATPRLPERRYQLRIVQYAVLAGWDVWHDAATNAAASCFGCARANRPSRFSCPTCGRPSTVIRNPPGKLDLELLRPPRIIFAEVKAEDGRLSADQTARITRLRECPGVEVYTWWPRDWPDVVRILARPEWDLDLIVPKAIATIDATDSRRRGSAHGSLDVCGGD